MDNITDGIIGIVFLLSGYTNGADLTVGAGFHAIEPDKCISTLSEITCTKYGLGADPLGIIRLSTSPVKNFSFVATHISSIPNQDDDKGLNIVSLEYTIKIGAKK